MPTITVLQLDLPHHITVVCQPLQLNLTWHITVACLPLQFNLTWHITVACLPLQFNLTWHAVFAVLTGQNSSVNWNAGIAEYAGPSLCQVKAVVSCPLKGYLGTLLFHLRQLDLFHAPYNASLEGIEKTLGIFLFGNMMNAFTCSLRIHV